MKRHSMAWRNLEYQASKIFGAVRNRYSGACPTITGSTSDAFNDRLYVECKMRAKHSLCRLMDTVRAKARREREYRTGIVVIKEHGERGCIICLHCDDLETLARPDDLSDLPLFNEESVQK